MNREWIKKIPKTDLHLHLDGSLRLETLIDLAKKQKVDLPSYSEEGLRKQVFKETYKDLPDYLQGFMFTTSVLRDSEALERCAYELAIDNQNEGVYYIEVRFAPQLFITEKISYGDILCSVDKGFKRAQKEFNQNPEVLKGIRPEFHYGLIVCAMRFFNEHFSDFYKNFIASRKGQSPLKVRQEAALELVQRSVEVRDTLDIPVVGFDLAGEENGYPAIDFREAYQYAHDHFMHKTVHAGEAYGAESIFQAITSLHADRMGHGYYLFDESKVRDPKMIPALVDYIAEKRITIEVCLSSNLQTNAELKSLEEHSFKKMLENKLSVSLCTDNRLVSHTTVSREIELALDHFDISPKQLRDIIVYGFKRSFFPGRYPEKRKYVRQIMNYYNQIAP